MKDGGEPSCTITSQGDNLYVLSDLKVMRVWEVVMDAPWVASQILSMCHTPILFYLRSLSKRDRSTSAQKVELYRYFFFIKGFIFRYTNGKIFLNIAMVRIVPLWPGRTFTNQKIHI